MEKLLGNLLEILEGEYPDSFTVSKLMQKGVSPDAIKEAINHGLLNGDMDLFLDRKGRFPNPNMSCTLSTEGLKMLTQIRIGKSVEELDESIKDFSKTSTRYSIVIVILTIILAILTGVMVYKMFM